MMNEFLLKNNYLIIDEFIPRERAVELAKEFRECDEFYEFPGDRQALNSASIYNYLPSLEILCEKTPEVSNYIGETVLPTYSYSRIYKNNSELIKHTDRPACEISLTLHLDGDEPWPIWIETPEGNTRCVTLNSGDAMVYLGCVAPHWRDMYRGEWYAQVFLHYVRSRGECGGEYFDKAKPITGRETDEIVNKLRMTYNINTETKEKTMEDLDQRLENLFIKLSQNLQNKTETNSSTNEENLKVDVAQSPIVVSEKKDKRQDSRPTLVGQSRTPVEDYIVFMEKIIPDELCDRIIQEFKNDPEWQSARTGGGLDTTTRRCDAINMSESPIIASNPEVRKKIDDELYEHVANILREYEKKFPHLLLEIKEDSGYTLLRYNTGDFYVEHTDSFKEQPRALSVTINLNDDYDGGEFAFFNREVVAKIPKGSAIVFPSNFMYPHEVMPVTKGTRYSIITWLV